MHSCSKLFSCTVSLVYVHVFVHSKQFLSSLCNRQFFQTFWPTRFVQKSLALYREYNGLYFTLKMISFAPNFLGNHIFPYLLKWIDIFNHVKKHINQIKMIILCKYTRTNNFFSPKVHTIIYRPHELMSSLDLIYCTSLFCYTGTC